MVEDLEDACEVIPLCKDAHQVVSSSSTLLYLQRERETERQTDRQTDRQRQRQRHEVVGTTRGLPHLIHDIDEKMGMRW